MITISSNEARVSILSFSSSFACVRLSEQGMQIHISQTTKDHLEHEPYIIEERGKIFVKVSHWKLHVWPYSVTRMTKKKAQCAEPRGSEQSSCRNINE